MPSVSRLVLAALAFVTIAAPYAHADAAFDTERIAPVRARSHEIRIAIIGAGPAGLTAAYTLRNLGYARVTVYEKNGQAGGRVYTSTVLGYPIELGAVFVSEGASLTLGYANQYGVPYVANPSPVYVLDDDGAVLEIGEFGLHKYGFPILAAIQRYAAVLETYRPDEIVSMAGLPPELKRPFSEFAESKGIMPFADVVRPALAAFGYPYYEDVPAMYLLRVMAGLAPVLPSGGLAPRPRTFGFPGGFQEVFTKLAADLGSRHPGPRPRRPYRFLYNAEVTKVRRRDTGRPTVKITANGHSRVYDRVIIATPPSATKKYLDMTAEEAELLGQVESRNYHVNLSIVLGMPAEKSSLLLLLYPNTRPTNIGHLNAWSRYGAASVFRTDQNVGWSQSTAEAQQLLVQDFESYGGGTVAAILLHKEWDNFAHFGTTALENGAYERLEGLQGKKGTFYATGMMTIDSIETVSRYARDLVNANF